MPTINTNVNALTAVQSVNNAARNMEAVQDRISSGLKTTGSKEKPASYGIAQNQRAELGSLETVIAGLNRASSIADVALASAGAISDLFTSMRKFAVAASDPSMTEASRTITNRDFVELRDQIKTMIANAQFDGAGILGGPAGTFLNFLDSTDGLRTVGLPVLDFRLPDTPGPVADPPSAIYVGKDSTILTASDANDMSKRIVATLDYVNGEMARLAAASKRVETQTAYFSKIMDNVTSGIGNIVDADLAKETAQLEALKVRKGLSTTSISMSNQPTQALLNLLRNV
ncbi:flagellin [Candidatus Phycosocius spiralis]|uniref:Flagellin n=1 Tax=Candidatus Phycosocius spiralis TaxID=2815099 RepID=A0ABQ4PYX4_9PROT|nr:flagellin [Candidatus Phycosocius spiralis]GIU68120.1 flagellin [Candidatus Phycosocius spiralis]